MKIMSLNCELGIVDMAKAGDKSAMETLVDAYRPAVKAHAFRLLNNHDDANDATQETFVKAFRAIKSFDETRPFLPWIMRICTNCCVDIIRNRKRGTEGLDRVEHKLCDEVQDIDAGIDLETENAYVKGAIKRLPVRYRDIIEMRHYRHMEVNEIALELNKPEGTVKSWLFRARALLRKDLAPVLGV